MKKLFISLVAAIVAATATFAQSSLVATLSHQGEVSVFHGANSLRQAMEAADHGDIITLASGRYNAANIDKAITLRGAGVEEDTITGAFRTQIVGNFNINIADTISEHLTIEGIYHESTITFYGTLNNAMLQKCRFSYISYNSAGNTVNSLTCIHCNITSAIGLPQNSSASFISSVVTSPNNQYGGTMEFTNCIIQDNIIYIRNAFFQNCIFNAYYTGFGSQRLSGTCMATYCVGWSYGASSPFENISKTTNTALSQEQVNALFKPNTFYELTDEAKSEYVGIDGMEIGIYGGNIPYDTRILSPQITKCKVAAKTTADGKLSVDIEVKAAE
jgi:hypothetical protein